jgi:hypothetical protein
MPEKATEKATETAAPEPSATVEPSATTITERLVVEVTRLVIITGTALPTHTALPTYTAEPTSQPPWSIQAAHDAEVARRWDLITVRLAEWFLSPACLSALVVLFGLTFGLRWFFAWRARELQRVDDVEPEPERNAYSHAKYPDWRARAWHLRKVMPPAGITEIVRDLWPENLTGGGSQFYLVKHALRQYDPAGEYGPPTPPTAEGAVGVTT